MSRKRYSKRFRKYKKTRKKFKKGAMSLAKKNYRTLKFLKKGIESKYKDNNSLLTSEGVDSSGHVVMLNGVSSGAEHGERIGNEITCRKIKLRGLYTNTNANASDTIIRHIIVRAKLVDGVAPTINELLTDTSINAFYEKDYQKKFKVYMDETFTISAGADGQGFIPFKITLPLNHIQQYAEGDTGATITSIQNNVMYMFVLSNHAADGNQPTITARCRFSYVDM